ncbi:MAG: right-handed parallel beta-helix repeat-containing protein [Candidatus Zixiibacteriota bacterium]|nr:MAG: right-handed parallel beta-helix repeat-containing protein [candidate division Zixibacteria bacterium]
MNRIWILTIILLALAYGLSWPTVINIPADYPTIQQGIDASADNDTVLVQPATYIENINFNGHNIVLGSLFLTTGDTSYISSTVIDGDSAGSVVTFENEEDSTAIITGFTIQNGYAPLGGGIYCLNSTPIIRNNKIVDNVAEGYLDQGGGIYCQESDAVIIANKIISNYSDSDGGGLYFSYCSPALLNCEISYNSARSGGGIVLRYSNALIKYNLIRGNSSSSALAESGGISCGNDSDPIIMNNTICENVNLSYSGSGGISIPQRSDAVVLNNILWYNVPNQIVAEGGDITYCCVEGGWPGTGNIPDNPLFVDRIGSNYNIYSNSPCIDAGDPTIIDPDSTRSDIGKFFYTHPSYVDRDIWFVSPSGNDQTGDGSQGNPFRTIQHAVDLANDEDTVIAAQGTYQENIHIYSKDLIIASNFLFSNDTLEIANTIIDGNDSGSVLLFENCSDSSKITGFTITNGDSENGGGISCLNSEIVITQNFINYNRADTCGGGIYCLNSNANITDNRIENNYGYREGGGVYLGNSGGLFLSNNVRLNRTGNGEGGGITCNNSNLEIRDNLISENRRYGINCEASSNGTIVSNTIMNNGTNDTPEWGGIYCYGSSPDIINNIIIGNRGPGIRAPGSHSLIQNNTICQNNRYLGAGGIDIGGSDLTVKNCIVWNNVSPQISGAGQAQISYSDVDGGWPGTGNIDSHPMFVNPSLGDFNICTQSPCIDAGDPSIIDPDSTRSDIGVYFDFHPDCDYGNRWYVSTTGNDSTGNGSYENPFRTVQYAINISNSVDTIVVENGTYMENLVINGKNLSLVSNYLFSNDTLDIRNTIIDGDSAGTTVSFEFCDSTTKILGFTIRFGRGRS